MDTKGFKLKSGMLVGVASAATQIEGERARFGIVKINYETQERTVNKSSEFFSEIIKNKGVTDEMYEEFVTVEKYKY